MKISLIVPIYNENKTIVSMLEQLEKLPGDWEILFADGGSRDDTLTKIGDRYTVLHAPKGRANQINFAAGQVSGDVVWFVHCDSVLPNDAHDQISAAVEKGAKWGCFRIGFDCAGLFMSCNTLMSNLRAKRGIAFGDQGIWVQRELFDLLGGFPDLPIMEDYEFSLELQRKNIPICQLPGQIITSGRRYEKRFPLITMWQMFYLRCLYRRGVDIREIARRYKDIR
jgi:rSAM/selenodomain-associated transferase 2